jgi:hypothetical protein
MRTKGCIVALKLGVPVYYIQIRFELVILLYRRVQLNRKESSRKVDPLCLLIRGPVFKEPGYGHPAGWVWFNVIVVLKEDILQQVQRELQ